MLQIANLEIRPGELQVLIDDRRAGLTVREFELFFMLAERLDSVVQRPQIYTAIWGGDRCNAATAPSTSSSARSATSWRCVAPEWRYIHTHFGIGYRFSPERTS